MDDYSSSGPKDYKSEARKRVREREKLLHRALEERTEEGFLAMILDINPGISLTDPGIQQALKIWRMRHP